MGGGRRGAGGAQAAAKAAAAAAAAPMPESKLTPVPSAADDESVAGEEKSRRTCLHTQLRKTKICIYHLRGQCQYNTSCAFAHTCTELQATPDLTKTRICKAFAAGLGCFDKECTFAHGEEELRSTNMFYKKTLCMWNEKGKCRNGDQCRFAHGNVELRGGSPAEVAAAAAAAKKATAEESSTGKATTGRRRASGSKQQLQAPPVAQQPQQVQTTQSRKGSGDLNDPVSFPEPMKVNPSSGLADPRSVQGGYDEALNDHLEQLRQKISVLSMRCSQMQTQAASSAALEHFRYPRQALRVSTPPGLAASSPASTHVGTDSPSSSIDDRDGAPLLGFGAQMRLPQEAAGLQGPPGLNPALCQESAAVKWSEQLEAVMQQSMHYAIAQAEAQARLQAAAAEAAENWKQISNAGGLNWMEQYAAAMGAAH